MPLLLASGVVAYLVMPHVDEMLAEWFRGDVELNASLIASSVEDRLATLVERRDVAGMRRYLSRVAADKHLAEVLVCGPDDVPLYQTSFQAPEVTCGLAAAPQALVAKARNAAKRRTGRRRRSRPRCESGATV